MVADLIRQARRRFFRNEMLAWSARAMSAALAGMVLLLILGTQILGWQWLVLFPAVCFAGGLMLAVRRLPSHYLMAQRIDRRLALADTLSTACYFSNGVRAGFTSEGIRLAQQAEAERVSRTVDVKQAVPFTLPSAIYAMAVLGLVASSLFALRYVLDRRLDLRVPLAQIIHESMGGSEPQQQAGLQKKNTRMRRENLEDTTGLALPDEGDKNLGELDSAPDSALDTIGIPDVSSDPNGPSQSSGKQQKRDASELQGEQAETETADDAQSSGEGDDPDGRQGEGKPKQGEQAASKQGGGAKGEQQSSLSAKLREAMANLLSRMRQQDGSVKAQSQNASAAGQKSGKQQGKGGQKGAAGQGQQQSSGQEGAESEDGQAGENAQNAQNAQGKGSGESDEQASNQPGSGMGRQDGAKDVKLAEQLAAMGKISEIIGKRAANVTGEVTVEVQSTSQQLRTPYSRRSASHAETGSEISRDEVPVVFQSYVEQYFEQMRTQETARPAPAAEEPAPGLARQTSRLPVAVEKLPLEPHSSQTRVGTPESRLATRSYK